MELKVDDVVQAFRWILGREPESFDVIKAKQDNSRTHRNLRSSLLRSTEFRKDYTALVGDQAVATLPRHYLDADAKRLVFLHIPKTGGTTLHELLAENFEPSEICTERQNRLWYLHGAELASFRFFSGHYDRCCEQLIPGKLKIVTVLREPRARLISLYRYLRAHTVEIIEREDLEMAKAANEMTFGNFLRAAMKINPASIDNTYLRTFAASLPRRRWEQRAEDGEAVDLQKLGAPIEQLIEKAKTFLDNAAAVGILEQFDLSLNVIYSAWGLSTPPSKYLMRHQLADLVRANISFKSIEQTQIDDEDEGLVLALTQFDDLIYEHGKRLLLERARMLLPESYESPQMSQDYLV
jgi:hypothetical protein